MIKRWGPRAVLATSLFLTLLLGACAADFVGYDERSVAAQQPSPAYSSAPVPEDMRSVAWFQLSPDDSTSMASAQILKSGVQIPGYPLQPHEVINYYDPPAALRSSSDSSAHWITEQGYDVVLDLHRPLDASGSPSHQLELLLHVYAPAVELAQRRPYNLHLCVDVSGSMSGDKIEFVRYGLGRLLDALRPGDRVSLTTFSSEARLRQASVPFEQGQQDLRRVVDDLQADGSTDMIAGLQIAYQQAQDNFDPQAINRVILFSDGQANVGETDVETFARLTRINDQEGIYLSGVGVGADYALQRMDELTDAGKGAHVFVPNRTEAEVVFGRMLRKLIEVAADEVSLELALPDTFSLVGFSGEEASTDPQQRVANVVLASGDDLTVLATFTTTDLQAFDDGTLYLTVRYTPLDSGVEQRFSRRLDIADALKDRGPLMRRTELVNRYARLACGRDPDIDAAALRSDLQAYQSAHSDEGIDEVRRLLRTRIP